MKPPVLAVLLALSAPVLFAATDLAVGVANDNVLIPTGTSYTGLVFTVYNYGPDAAKDVKLSVFSSNGIPVDCACDIGDVAVSTPVARRVAFTPTSTGPLTITATVTSSTPDTNQANDTVAQTLTVSNDPDVILGLFYPTRQDLGVPFTLDVYFANTALVTAHSVDVTIDFPTSVAVRSLPSGCTNPEAGRVVCHADTVPANQRIATKTFSIVLVAPTDYGSGKVAIVAAAAEAEHDFNAGNNTATAQITLYKTFYVTTTANDGGGSLRQAILDANAGCGTVPCAIGFKIAESSSTPWKTIRIDTPLPPLTTTVRIDGATQSALVAAANANGPDVEISGGANAGDGLTVAVCGVEIANLAINGFPNNGVSVSWTSCDSGAMSNLHHLYIGSDPTGTIARPNLRGIGLTALAGKQFTSGPEGIGADTLIHDCVISGNQRSGIFDLGGRVSIAANRIGVKAHNDEPLPNGNAGVYIGPGAHGSDIGVNIFGAQFARDFVPSENVIAFNGQMGVAIASTVAYVAVRHNRIWGNGGLGIDIGLDGPQASVPPPVITLAHYDPAAKQTVIEGDTIRINDTFYPAVDLFANDAPDPSGLGEGQRPLGPATVDPTTMHFRLAVDGDLTGQFITGTTTHVLYEGFAKPEPNGVDQGFLSTTTEFSRAVEVR